MKAEEIEIAVARYFGWRQNLIIPNLYYGLSGLYYEADLVVVTKSGYAYEVEIKISKQDLIRDRDKKHKHDCKHFRGLYFAIPEKLYDKIKDNVLDYIPEDAGLIVCNIEQYNTAKYYVAQTKWKPKPRKVEPLTLEQQLQVARLGTMRVWSLKKKIINLKQKEK